MRKTSTGSEPSLGLFECLALLTAFVLQIASLLTSLQEHSCAKLQPGARVPVAATAMNAAAAAENCRGG